MPTVDFGTITVSSFDPAAQIPIKAAADYAAVTVTGFDPTGQLVAPSVAIKFLKAEFCRFEDDQKTLRVRIKLTNQYLTGKTNEFTAKIINSLGMEYDLEDWTETIGADTAKLVKTVDLNTVMFLDGKLPLNVGTHTLQIQINSFTASSTFKVVPITVERLKKQQLLGVNLEANAELGVQQPLRKITGVDIIEVSQENTVGAKELTWDAANQTLAFDYGEPVEITDDYTEYYLTNHMTVPGVTDGDYIKVEVLDVEELPETDQTEIILIDTKRYSIEDFQYWVNNAHRVVTEAVIGTSIEPTLYSSDKDEGAKYLDPVYYAPKNYSETTNIHFEFPVNMLQDIIALWVHHRGAEKINVDLGRVEFSRDGEVVVRGFPHNRGFAGNTATIGLAGIWDRTIYAKTHPGSRNKAKNFWQGRVIAGIADPDMRELALDIVAKIAAIDLLIQAGLGKGAGISSRSMSVGGISTSYNTTESAENSLYSGIITDLQRRLGVGKATRDEQRTGLIAALKGKIQGNMMGFKY